MCDTEYVSNPRGEVLRTTTNLGLVHMIVVPFVGAPDCHHNKVLFSVQTEVVHRGF